MAHIKKALSLLLVVVLLFSVAAAAADQTFNSPGEAMYAKLEIIEQYMRALSPNTGEDDDLLKEALIALFNDSPEAFNALANAMLSLNDRYSQYIPPGTYAQHYSIGSTRYTGIGVSIEQRGKDLLISHIFIGSPAQDEGLLPGDAIISVDGKPMYGKSVDTLSTAIRGEEGTQVVIGVRRPGAPLPIYKTLTRASVRNGSCFGQDLGGGIYLISITSFAGFDTIFDFNMYLGEAAQLGAKKLIFDVRGNPGGEINCLLTLLDLVTPGAGRTLLGFEYKDASQNETILSTGRGKKFDKVVVLTDGRTASSGEAFAGSLQANGIATVIGQKTYGKGLGQFHIPLEDDDYVVLTYTTVTLPNGKPYDEAGIQPDRVVEYGTKPMEVPHISELLNQKVGVGAQGPQVLAIEQRLSVLGYFVEEPDYKFDSYTLKAINAFRADNELESTTECGFDTLALLKAKYAGYINRAVPFDAQLQAAIYFML